MHRLLAVAAKELRHITRDIRIFFLVTISPTFLLLVLAYIFAFDIGNVSLGWLDEDRSETARRFLAAVTADGTFQLREAAASRAALEAGLLAGRLDIAVIVPAGFERDLARPAAWPVVVQALADGADAIAASQVLSSLSARVSAFGAQWLPAVPHVEIRTRAWYNSALKSLLSMVPGLLAIVLTLPALALTLSVTREREVGTLEAIVASPLRGPEYLLGKLAAYVLSGLASAALAAAVAVLWFHVPLRGSFALFLALAALFYLACMGVSLLIAQFASTQQTAMLLVLFVFFVPSFFVAGLIQPVHTASLPALLTSYALPTTHFIAICRAIFLKGAGLAEVRLHVALLALLATGGLSASLLAFRKQIG